MHGSYTWLALLLALPATLGATPGTDAGADAAPMPAEVVEFFTGVETMRGDFRQILFDPAGNVAETSTGRLAIARPGRFRWEYSEPYEQLIVADGETLWLHDVDLEQVTVREQTETIRSSPAMLLGGDARALDAFHFDGTFSAEGHDWLRLVPTATESDFTSVSLAFAEGELVMMDLIDALRQTTRIEFSDLVLNADLDPALFTFEVPPDVDVIGAEVLSRAGTGSSAD